MDGKWFGRIGYDREGIVREREFRNIAEAEAYRQGALDMKEQSDLDEDGVLVDYWATASNLESNDVGTSRGESSSVIDPEFLSAFVDILRFCSNNSIKRKRKNV